MTDEWQIVIRNVVQHIAPSGSFVTIIGSLITYPF